ncbi:MAG: hypothetical protein KF760_30350 [Candidatus Eremiobacteraeota bacterium]|nr:hypothetical protein [Candidatus Eremiobacteraeota bacterium]MCW5868118.1 hypothetical protein [Candidatus Eremiobacteraeota bacterium]
MKPLWFFLCCCLGLVRLGLAEPLSYQKEFELQLCPDGSKLEPPLSGDAEATMKLVRELFERAGPKIGSRFVESCYLLCLGDLRPYAAWNGFMTDPQPQDDEVIDNLNRYLVPRGYSLHLHKPRPGEKQGSFSLHSLEGLDKRTRETRLAWIPRYRRETGWPGYYRWKKEIYRRLPEKGPYNFDKVEGVMLGYPDVAVEHFENLVWSDWPTTVDAYLPESRFYTCGLPIYSLRWQDAADPGLVALESEWRTFLAAAWASPTHKALAREQAFIHARRQRTLEEAKPDTLPNGDARYAEAFRYGYTWRAREECELDSDLERWLPAHAGDLCQALAENSNLQEVARASGHPRLRSEHLWSWILRGSCLPDSDAGRLFEVFQRQHPDVLLQLYRKQLNDKAEQILRRGETDNPGWDGQAFAQMLGCSYCRSLFPQLAGWEQQVVLKAARSRSGYAPLARLLQASPYAGKV